MLLDNVIFRVQSRPFFKHARTNITPLSSSREQSLNSKRCDAFSTSAPPVVKIRNTRMLQFASHLVSQTELTRHYPSSLSRCKNMTSLLTFTSQFCLIALLVSVTLLLGVSADPGLQQVFVAFRHGIRTPVIPLPFVSGQEWKNTFPMQVTSSNFRETQLFYISPGDNNILMGNSFSGELTDSGSKMHQALGAALAEKYSRRLGMNDGFPEGKIHAETTWKPRTIRSLLSHLSGWFPKGAPISPPAIITNELTDLYANWYEKPQICPPVKDLYDRIVQEDRYLEYTQQQEPFRQHLSEKLSVPLDEVDFFFLHDTLACYVAEGFTLPRNLTMDEYNKIEEIATWEYNYYFKHEDFTRLSIGSMLNRMQQFMKANDTKLFLFSGHDMSIFPLLLAHRYVPNEWPTFASNIVWEVYDNQTIKIFYNQDIQLSIEGCGYDYCPLDKYFESIEWAVMRDWKQECSVSSSNDLFSKPLTEKDYMRAKCT